MSGLILEIQAEALDSNAKVTDLLRKALVASKKLNIADMQQWIADELSGYSSPNVVPEYRRLRGRVQVWNPYHGLQPLNMPEDLAEMVGRIWLTQSAAELESLIEQNKTGMVRFSLEAAQSNYLMKNMEVPMEPRLSISATEIVGVMDTVRNHILNWALELERSGVVGEGLSFSVKEVQAASTVNYVTNIGTMAHSQIQQHSSGSQTMSNGADLSALMDLMLEIKQAAAMTPSASAREAVADAETIMAQVGSPKPKDGILRESLKSLRSILEGASGSALGDLLPKLIAVTVAAGMS